MFRKLAAITLFISFIAMATSGILMIIVGKTSFTLQMHPVHKLFGIIMVIAASCHISLNFPALMKYMKTRAVAITGGVLTVLLVLLYGVALNRELPADMANKLDALAEEVENKAEGK